MEYICSFCKNKFTDQKTHFNERKCTILLDFQSSSDFRVIFENGKCGCKRCCKLFQTVKQYSNHTKSCKKQSQKTRSLRNSGGSANFANNIVEAIQYKSDTKAQIYSRFHLNEDCQKYTKIVQKPHRMTWIQKNAGFEPLTLFNFYRKFINDCFGKLTSYIPEIKLNSLPKISKVNWFDIIKNPNQIFDKALIQSRILSYDLYRKNKIKMALNKLYELYPIQKFVIQKMKKKIIENPTSRQVLLPFEFIKILQALIQTQVKQIIHFCVDLMIIYQSGVRFPSSYQGIIAGIKSFRVLRQKKKDVYGFVITSSKTKIRHNVVFDQQLIQLIQLLNWQSFTFAKRVYQRLTSFLPFSFQMIRRGYISFLLLRSGNAVARTSLLSQHKSWKNVEVYTQKILISKHRQYKQDLRISNLNTTNKANTINNIQNILIVQRFQPENNWFQKAYNYLKYFLKDKMDEKMDILETKVCFTEPKHSNIMQMDQLQKDKQDNDEQSQEQQQQIEEIAINNRIYTLKNNKLDQNDLFQSFKKMQCSFCEQQSKFKCIFCGYRYCFVCRGLVQLCKCFKKVFGRSNFIVQSKILSQIKLQLPQIYFHQNQTQDQKQIAIIVNIRGYHYVRTCNDHYRFRRPQFTDKIAFFNLPLFQKYQNFSYFPPIYIKLFGDLTFEGVGFGLFAKQQIDKHILIGEYAADIFNGVDQKFCHRKDMIFNLSAHKDAQKDSSVGPIQHCGYVPLINDLERKNNCKSVRVVINQKIRIIVYTSKRIHKNEQLGYSYSRKQYQSESSEDQIQNQIIIYPNEVKIKNLGVNCYLNVILQLFRHQKRIFKVSQAISQLFIQINKCYNKNTYNPRKICQYLNTQFPKTQKQDAHQLLLYLLHKLQTQGVSLDDIKVQYQQKLKCQQCDYQVTSKQKQFTLFIDTHNSIQNLKDKQLLNDYQCQICKELKVMSQCNYTSFGLIVIIVFKRFINLNKDLSNKSIPFNVTLNNSRYNLIHLINHIGETQQDGHYTFLDLDTQLLFSDQEITKSVQIQKNNAYILVYRKIMI